MSLRIFRNTALPGGVFVPKTAVGHRAEASGSPVPRKILRLDADTTKSKALLAQDDLGVGYSVERPRLRGVGRGPSADAN